MDAEVIWRTLNDLAKEMREVRAELRHIRRLIEQDRGGSVEAIGKPLPRGPQLTEGARADTPIKEIAERVMARSHMVNGEVAGAMQRVASSSFAKGRIRNLTNAKARALRGS